VRVFAVVVNVVDVDALDFVGDFDGYDVGGVYLYLGPFVS
jgi:hypothetical protein